MEVVVYMVREIDERRYKWACIGAEYSLLCQTLPHHVFLLPSLTLSSVQSATATTFETTFDSAAYLSYEGFYFVKDFGGVS